MSPGAILFRLRQRFRHGLRVAYYRDVVRPRILLSPPIHGTNEATAELHALTSSQDWLNLMWAIKSFYHFSQRRYRLAIHDDGSLPAHARAAICEHFPDARLIDRAHADQQVLTQLEAYPQCVHFRRTNPLAPKLFDFTVFLQSERMLLFDSDLLFFKEPTALLRCVEDPTYLRNVFNGDFASGYTVDSADIAANLGHELLPRINSGLGLIHKGSIRFDWIEEFLSLPGILDGHFWRIEQTLIALCSSRFGADLLPEEYTLYLGPGIDGRPFRHYVGKIRHLMYREGIARLLSQGLLCADWSAMEIKQ